MALNDSPVAFATCLMSDTRLSGTFTVKTTFRSGTGTVRFILRASSMYRYACLLETPNRSMITDKASSLEEPSFNRERAALTRSASSACGDLLLICHNYTTFCVIMSSTIFVPNSGISHCLFKLKVIYCVGGVISPLLSNLYLNGVDEMMEKAREVTRRKGYDNLDFIRSADDMVILVHGHPKEDRLVGLVQRRLKEELDKLQVQMNQEKTRVVNLKEGGCFSFLGFDIRLNRNREGKNYVSKTPRMKKCKEIGRKVKAVLKVHFDKPLKEVIQAVNAVVRGWVNYFRVGNSTRTFCKVRDFVEKKVRRFVMKRKGLKGFGWKRWSREEIYEKLGVIQRLPDPISEPESNSKLIGG